MAKGSAKPKEDRLSIRANQAQKLVLSQAAQARHMNVSQFVLQASLREAEHVIEEDRLIRVSAEEYDWLAKTMDEAQPAPRLREALNTPPVWQA